MKKFLCAISLLGCAAGATAEVLTFDNVRFTEFAANYNGYELENLPFFGSNYGDLKWSDQFSVLRATGLSDRLAGTPANNGYINGLVSGDYVAFNGGAAPVSFESLTADALFNFNSVYLGAAWYSSLSVAVAGFRDGVQLFSTTIAGLSFTDSVLVNFGWNNIDKVTFTSLDSPAGNPVDNQSTYNRSFVMDNLNVSAVPEPATYTLLLTGLGLAGALGRKRKRKAA